MTDVMDFDDGLVTLKRAAITAFGGTAEKLARGFRLRRSGDQSCAVYFRHKTNKPEHEVEIAISPKLPIGAAGSLAVIAWLEHEIDRTGRRGAKHYKDDWPTIGFTDIPQAIEFLARVGQLRAGTLSGHAKATRFAAVGRAPDTAAELLARFFRLIERAKDKGTVAYRLQCQRIGQALLRRVLLSTGDGCCHLTGLASPRLLRVSHIKPWSRSTDAERLDPENCLLLAAHLDAAFDCGLIGFGPTGELVVSDALTSGDAALLQLSGAAQLRTRPSPSQAAFLTWHRQHIFKTTS